jgi:O-antigen/teichoic acid export membrane protein
LILNLSLIPLIGVYGAAVATAASMILSYVYLRHLTAKKLNLRLL